MDGQTDEIILLMCWRRIFCSFRQNYTCWFHV